MSFIQSFDELIQPQRLTISDPLIRVAFGCDALIGKALEDRSWASLVTRMARSYSAVGQGARARLFGRPARGCEPIAGGLVAGALLGSGARDRSPGRLGHRKRPTEGARPGWRGPQYFDRNRNIEARSRSNRLACGRAEASRRRGRCWKTRKIWWTRGFEFNPSSSARSSMTSKSPA